jgi:Flp pilus assembly pilin Flp
LTRRLRHARDERGATAIELVIVTPLLMLVTFLIVQFALSWFGNEVAGATARETARFVRTGGSPAEAEARGLAYAASVGNGSLRDVVVRVRLIPGDQVEATVTGRSQEIINGFAPQVTQVVVGPIEQFRPDR